MSRSLNKLTVAQVRSIVKPGRHSDGGGLYLKVRKSGSKAWVFLSKKNGQEKELGLGSSDSISLADVRQVANDLRDKAKTGKPLALAIDETKQVVPTFKDGMEHFLTAKEQGWKSEKHRAQWRMTLGKYAKPLHNMLLTEITTPDVLRILEPIWLTKHETASRLRGRIEAVLDYGKAMGWRSGENPAVWRGNLRILLPHYSKARNVKHHAALPFEEILEFMPYLKSREAITARLLEFIILTAARSGEARNATFHEIDIKSKTWTIPKDRMKMGREHTVPLSERALEIVTDQAEFRPNDLIFANPNSGRAFDVNATRMLMKRMECGQFTTHGFRSTFRDWAGDKTMHQRETIEAALAHGIKNKVEAAYRRSSALEKRRMLMDDWAAFCGGVA